MEQEAWLEDWVTDDLTRVPLSLVYGGTGDLLGQLVNDSHPELVRVLDVATGAYNPEDDYSEHYRDYVTVVPVVL